MIARRRLLLGAALAATLGTSWWASTLEQEAPGAPAGQAEASRPRRALPTPADPAATTLAGLDAPRAVVAEPPGLFRPRSLQPPPPPPPPPPKPPKPQAPPLPFRFVGAVEEGGERMVFVLDGNQVRMLRAGDQLGGQYRVERITPASVEFTYLPLQQRQTLATARP